ncbi:hypothetical protein GEMRC1_000008 [Eukaryota sp. GEM-RC1]
MYHYCAQRPTVITVGNSKFPLLTFSSTPERNLRLKTCKFLKDVQGYSSAIRRASEALIRPAAFDVEIGFLTALGLISVDILEKLNF